MRTLLYTILATLLLSSHLLAQTWTGTWSTSQQIPEPQNALPTPDLLDATLRQTVHVSTAGSTLRIHLSNAFGTRPLHITSAHIARPKSPASSAIDPATDRTLLFNGSPDILIPPAAEYLSDPIPYPLPALSDLTISLHIEADPGGQTGHPGSHQTISYTHGDLTSAPDLPSASKIDHWFFLSAVDVQTAQTNSNAATIVTLGDSITDGHASTPNGNDRWPDILSQRLQANPATRNLGVLNQGIGGNHLLTDGLGPNALARFDRDVLAQTAVRYVIVLEGINDLGGLERYLTDPAHPTNPADAQTARDALTHRMIGAYQQIIARAHAHNLKVYGATITPDTGSDYYHPSPASEAQRQQINAWIRTPGHFDAVVDFDKTIADPSNPTHLLPAFDCGDHLHPNPAGYRAMAQSIDLSLFK
jgi:lysophospholipase L1-like esterase